jgi:hypothetical protein
MAIVRIIFIIALAVFLSCVTPAFAGSESGRPDDLIEEKAVNDTAPADTAVQAAAGPDAAVSQQAYEIGEAQVPEVEDEGLGSYDEEGNYNPY